MMDGMMDGTEYKKSQKESTKNQALFRLVSDFVIFRDKIVDKIAMLTRTLLSTTSRLGVNRGL